MSRSTDHRLAKRTGAVKRAKHERQYVTAGISLKPHRVAFNRTSRHASRADLRQYSGTVAP